MKKITLVILLTFFFGSSVFAASELLALTDFIDVEPGTWYEDAIADLRGKSIIVGYEDSTFRPANFINRAEIAVLISKVLAFVTHPEGSEPWLRHVNKEFLFAIDYPPTWETVELAPHAVGFRPPWMPENQVQWALIVRDNTLTLLDELIAEMGSGFPDTRAETRQQIFFNGKNVWHVVVTTSEKPNWRYEQIFIEHYDKLFIITNGAIENSDFNLFWRSLKFLAPGQFDEEDVPDNGGSEGAQPEGGAQSDEGTLPDGGTQSEGGDGSNLINIGNAGYVDI